MNMESEDKEKDIQFAKETAKNIRGLIERAKEEPGGPGDTGFFVSNLEAFSRHFEKKTEPDGMVLKGGCRLIGKELLKCLNRELEKEHSAEMRESIFDVSQKLAKDLKNTSPSIVDNESPKIKKAV